MLVTYCPFFDLLAPIFPKRVIVVENIERKLIDNPELMALLALIFDLRNNYKAVVTETGEFEQ